MGQRQDRQREASQRVEFDPEGDNGLVLSSTYIPEELLGEIFCYIDPVTLLSFQLVCQRWKNIIQEYVWRKKAELVFGQSLQSIKDLRWSVYYHICRGKLFERNLVKNHSGQTGLDKSWHIISQGGDHWRVEKPPVGVTPLPKDPVFEGNQSCFATSYYTCTKSQAIDLVAEGFNAEILDNFQPSIMVGEWYSARWDCPAIYELLVILVNDKRKEIDRFQFFDAIDGSKQNEWHHVSHEFENYGPGVRKIIFQHTGKDSLFWAGHYGSKMAGASVVFKVPQKPPTSTEPRRISSASLDVDAKMYYADLETESDSDLNDDD
ncbi:F-box only protein 6 [Diachasma alloeum]|uniref:F-box only protein 6 n=1 Tax=Diachasma alloeum TaxID=454923 RepID=UPI0007382389|nr:F-box only protein 6 [Diachasma alloeum]XP_015110554.1 F-box only protein 6 [Diachasma alloeum]XP_015110563.1 F-box only protein 6 [Diachasma alloeum]